MVKSMADKPIIFAMANPDPEITPEDVAAIRKDAFMATGSSDYPNQINNVHGRWQWPIYCCRLIELRMSSARSQPGELCLRMR